MEDEFERAPIVSNEMRKNTQTQQCNHPLIIVLNEPNNHNLMEEFKRRSREKCITHFDCDYCTFHGATIPILIYFGLQGTFELFLIYILQIKCNTDNLHHLDDALGPDFNYSCQDFHTLLYLLSFDGIFSFVTIFTSIMALVKLRHCLLMPMIVFSALRLVLFTSLIFIYSDFINIPAILGILYSLSALIIFYPMYKIIRNVNRDWSSTQIEMMSDTRTNC
eukprot:600036_1